MSCRRSKLNPGGSRQFAKLATAPASSTVAIAQADIDAVVKEEKAKAQLKADKAAGRSTTWYTTLSSAASSSLSTAAGLIASAVPLSLVVPAPVVVRSVADLPSLDCTLHRDIFAMRVAFQTKKLKQRTAPERKMPTLPSAPSTPFQ